MLDCLIRCRPPVLLHPSTFGCLCILDLSCSNHNYKVLITLRLDMHVERNGPHTPCSHAKKLKNVTKN